MFGFFCVRLTRIYFAMLTLAFAQIVWAICFKWNEVTGGEQGLPGVPYPDFAWIERAGEFVPILAGWRTAEYFYFVALARRRCALLGTRRIVDSPFGRVLTVIRDNPERAQFIGVNVRGYQLAAFVFAGTFAGLAGGLFGIFNRGVFPDFAYWNKSAEVLIMTLLAGRTASTARRSARRRSSGSTSRSSPIRNTGRSFSGRSSSCCSSFSRPGSPARSARSCTAWARGCAVLEVRGLAKSFDGFRAVGGVSFDVPQGSISAVISRTAPARPPCSISSPGTSGPTPAR